MTAEQWQAQLKSRIDGKPRSEAVAITKAAILERLSGDPSYAKRWATDEVAGIFVPLVLEVVA